VPFPPILTGGAPTIGLRVPDHPCPRALARALGPLPTTSANRSGEPSALTAEEVALALGDRISLVLDGGASRGGTASTVVDCAVHPPTILRPGAVDRDTIARRLAEAGITLTNEGR
jgi:L-threonylcarbamoyladenylate synthase